MAQRIVSRSKVFAGIGYFKSTPFGLKIAKLLASELLTPREIGKSLQASTSNVSAKLTQMKKLGLVECVNEEAHVGRLYGLTWVGREALEKHDSGLRIYKQ